MGHEIVDLPSEADLVVINTCAVTSKAVSDSRGAIRRVGRLSGDNKIIATGCWATIDPASAGSISGVQRIIPNHQKDSIVSYLCNLPMEDFYLKPVARLPLPGSQAHTRAFIKVQDGCDNDCTFCLTTIARGISRSRSVHEIHKDVLAVINGGTQEIVLSGVHLGAWGHDLSPSQKLPDLISYLLDKTSITRIRLSSLEPWDLDNDFFKLWFDKRLCRHLHLPLQSGSASVLSRMNRKTTPGEFADLVKRARSMIPAVAITTDIITGFPGETEKEFNESKEFINKMEFASGHVFTFSPRPGTVAANLPDQVNKNILKIRSKILRHVFSESANSFRKRFLNQNLSVLWESAKEMPDHKWKMWGLTDNYLRVCAISSRSRKNCIDIIHLVELKEEILQGTFIKD